VKEGAVSLSGIEEKRYNVRLLEIYQRSILHANQKENGIKMLRVCRDNIIPFLEIREGSNEAGMKQGTHPGMKVC
jgi:hypothetical protein